MILSNRAAPDLRAQEPASSSAPKVSDRVAGAPRPASPVIEILGPWVKNKGDALMLEALIERFGQRAFLAASPEFGLTDPRLARVLWVGSYVAALRAAIGRGRAREAAKAVRNGMALRLLPRRMTASRGVVPGRGVDVLLDCSGFAYGDQWSTRRLLERAPYYEALKARGKILVMLPQALGPFERPDMREAVEAVLRPFDLICPRDAQSLAHVQGLGVEARRLMQVPDITHLIDGHPVADREAWSKRVAIVPNARMLDTTSPELAGSYPEFLNGIIEHVRSRGYEPWLVLHESNDASVVESINARASAPLPVLDEDARTTKGILSACHFVVSSRYHAIVASLSTGTPVIGTSWSHKYQALFEEYEAQDLLATPGEPSETSKARLDCLIDPDTNRHIRASLSEIAARKKSVVESMWTRIDEMIEGRAQR